MTFYAAIIKLKSCNVRILSYIHKIVNLVMKSENRQAVTINIGQSK